MDNVAIMIDEQDEEDPELYGLYRGTPLPDRSREGYAGSLPDTISIYRRPLVEDFGDDEGRLVEEIRITVLHELAHHFGLDEEELVRLGWGSTMEQNDPRFVDRQYATAERLQARRGVWGPDESGLTPQDVAVRAVA